MADYANIFVNAPLSLENFVRELESLLAIRCEFDSDAWEEWYVYHESPIWLSIGENDHESHRSIDFEDYRYDIMVGIRDEKRRQDFARSVFEKLKETKRYPLLLTDYDLQHVLDEYTPENYPQSSTLVLKARTLPSELILYVDFFASRETLPEDLVAYFAAQGLSVSQGPIKGSLLLPTMVIFVSRVQKAVAYDSIAKTIHEISSAPAGFSYEISAKARVHLPGGLAVPGERRYWVYELMMRLFEHLKVLGRYRLVLRDDDEDRDLAVSDPRAAEETTNSLKTL
jgi:hypothetical protein